MNRAPSTKTATPRTDAVVAELGPNMTVELCRELERELNALRQSGPNGESSQRQQDLWVAVRLMAEGSDWKRDQGETLTAWAQRKLRASSEAGADDAKDAARWRFYSCAQTACYLGTEHDPNEKIDWKAECDRLADRHIQKAEKSK